MAWSYRSPQALVYDFLVPIWWCRFRKLWDLRQAGPAGGSGPDLEFSNPPLLPVLFPLFLKIQEAPASQPCTPAAMELSASGCSYHGGLYPSQLCTKYAFPPLNHLRPLRMTRTVRNTAVQHFSDSRDGECHMETSLCLGK